MMALDDGLADMQTQAHADARAALYLHARHTIEALPDALLRIEWDARPLVAHPDTRLPILDGQMHLNRRLRRGIFQRVGQEVGHHLL